MNNQKRNTPVNVRVPAGKVLVIFWSDWFSDEAGFSTRNAGQFASTEEMNRGRLLGEGESIDLSTKLRDDDKHTWSVTYSRVFNHGGQARELPLNMPEQRFSR